MSRFSNLLLLGVLIMFVAGAIFPSLLPVSIVSPTSGSMEPTVPHHSVVVITDTSPAVGDIALYESPDRSQPVLHRLVGMQSSQPSTSTSSLSSQQFLTQGDANTETDQATGSSPVTPDQIRGTVATIGSTPIVIPYVGIPLSNPVFIITLWALLVMMTTQRSASGQTAHRLSSSYPLQPAALVFAVCIIVVGPIVITMTATPLTAELTTSATLSASQSHVAAPGTTTTHPVTVQSPLLAVVSITATTDSTSISVDSVSHQFGSPSATVYLTNTPSESPTVHQGTVSLYTYPPVLPDSTLHALHRFHTLAPSIISSLLLAFPIVLFAVTIDPARFSRPQRSRIYDSRKSHSPETPPSETHDTSINTNTDTNIDTDTSP